MGGESGDLLDADPGGKRTEINPLNVVLTGMVKQEYGTVSIKKYVPVVGRHFFCS